MRGLRIFLIVLVILTLLAFGATQGLMWLIRKKLAEGWIEEIEALSTSGDPEAGGRSAEQKGVKIVVPEGVRAGIKRNLAKLGLKDLTVLAKFSQRIKDSDYLGAAKMINKVKVILMEKTDLGLIKELKNILFPGE